MVITGCNTQLDDIILVAYSKSKQHMMDLWRGYANERIVSDGILRSDRENCWLQRCGQKGENCTAYCLDCARRFGFIW